MAIIKNGAIGRDLRTILDVGTLRDLTDGQLLERYSTGSGEAADAAFEALVDRHGPMVLRVCRGVLGDVEDARDSFQATFLVLIRRSRSLWVRDSLGPWLHQVAFRTAKAARSAEARRRRLDRAIASESPAEIRPQIPDDLDRALHEEVERLPERSRGPIVLCDLEGASLEQAARHLGVPIGTVKSRLSRGRERLRGRLARRGFAPVIPFAPGSLFPIEISIRSLGAPGISRGLGETLAQEVLRSMTITRWLKAASTLLLLGSSATGVTLLAQVGAPGEAEKREVKVAADDPGVVEFRPVKFQTSGRHVGSVEPSTALKVANQVEGVRQIIMLVPEGTAVRKGDIVCELDSSTLRDQLATQRISARQDEAAYRNAVTARQAAAIAVDEYNTGTFPIEEKALQNAIDEGRLAAQRASLRLSKAREARRKLRDMLAQRGGPTTPAELAAELDFDDRIDEAERTFIREASATSLAESKQSVLRKPTKERALLELSVGLATRQAEEFARESAWKLDEARIAKLEKQVEFCRLLAPADGMVVYANDRAGRPAIEPGATVRERQLVFSIPDVMGRFRVNVKVAESGVHRFREGQKARIHLSPFPGREVAGHVVSVAPVPDPPEPPGSIGHVYTVQVDVDEEWKGWRPGMAGDVDILLDGVKETPAVPVSSIFWSGGKTFVAVKLADGTFERREVTLGATDDSVVEVKQGLELGDKVAEYPGRVLREPEKRADGADPGRKP